jgi:hypothetical protein
MPDYLTILDMHERQQMSCREISAGPGCGKTAVSNFLSRFEKSDVLSCPLDKAITNERIEELLYQKRGGKHGTSRTFVEPDL